MSLTFYKPLETHFLGFDTFFERAQRAIDDIADGTPLGFPPFNLYKEGNGYLIEMALAGYRKNDIVVNHNKRRGVLSVRHTSLDKGPYAPPVGTTPTLLKQGIAKRNFTREFTVADNIVVERAEMVDGMLTIQLRQIEHEEDKPLRITVD